MSTGILKNTTSTGVPSIAVAADFPTLNQNTTGTAANVSGTVGIANGGTGSTTKNFVDLTNDQTIAGVKTFSGSSTVVQQNLTVNSAGTPGQGIILSDDGDIVDNNDGAATFRFTGGVKINNNKGVLGTDTKITLANNGNITATGSVTASQLTSNVTTGNPPLVVTSTTPVANLNIGGNAANVTGTVAIANGGTGQTTKAAAFDALSPMTASGDIIYGGTSGTGTRLAAGTNGQVLVLASGIPKWSNNIGGGVLAKTDSYDILATDSANLLVYSGSAASKTIKLPSASLAGAGREITIKNIASVSVSVGATSGSLISDSTTTSATSLSIGIEPSNNWIKAISDGTNWIILRALF